MVAVAALGFTGVGWLGDDAGPSGTTLASTQLFDDDQGKGMFALATMAPDVPLSRCIRVGYEGPSDAGPVTLAAEAVDGPLVGALDVTVDRGGEAAHCGTFSGIRVFAGSLVALTAAGTGDAGVSTGWEPVSGDTQTFRVTVTMNGAKHPLSGAAASAEFVWRVRSRAVAAPSSIPTPAVSPSGFVRRTAPPPVRSSDATPVATAGPSSSRSSAAVVDHDGQDPARPERRNRFLAAVDVLLRQLTRLAAEFSRHLTIPIGLLIATAAFLLFQGAADRRDPKLALAPVSRSTYLVIPLDREADE